MRRDRAGSAIAARDAGLRRVTRLTWQAAAAGVVGSALIAAAFGHGVSQQNAAMYVFKVLSEWSQFLTPAH